MSQKNSNGRTWSWSSFFGGEPSIPASQVKAAIHTTVSEVLGADLNEVIQKAANRSKELQQTAVSTAASANSTRVAAERQHHADIAAAETRRHQQYMSAQALDEEANAHSTTAQRLSLFADLAGTKS